MLQSDLLLRRLAQGTCVGEPVGPDVAAL